MVCFPSIQAEAWAMGLHIQWPWPPPRKLGEVFVSVVARVFTDRVLCVVAAVTQYQIEILEGMKVFFFFGSGFKERQSTMMARHVAGTPQSPRECEVATNISTEQEAGSRRMPLLSCSFRFSLYVHSGNPAHGMMSPAMRVGFPSV